MKLISFLGRAFQRFENSAYPLAYQTNMPRRRKYASNANNAFSLANVVKKLETFAPLRLAESWDNVGLLIEPASAVPIKRVLLTNDLSESVLEEALDRGVQLIVSYHPLIFPALKSIKFANWKERIISTLLHKQIALYSPHTAWDSVEGGVNDWLASAFGKDGVVEPLKRFDSGNVKIVNAVFDNADLAEKAHAAIISAENVFCSVHNIVQQNGKVWLRIHIENEYLCLPYLREASDVNISNHRNISVGATGVGRKVVLKNPISLRTAISLIKQHLKLPDVSVALAHGESFESVISTIGICAGSGGSVLKGVQTDLYLTGEMSHHEVLDAVHRGTHVILTRHSNSERGFLEVAAKSHLKTLLPEIEFVVSSKDQDPLVTV